MLPIIEKYKNIVIQIATPYSKGTGFYMPELGYVVTNYHVIEGNNEAIIEGENVARQIGKVVYYDQKFDLAFLEIPHRNDAPNVNLSEKNIVEGDRVTALGHPFGLKYSFTQGIISNVSYIRENVGYIQHDAALNPGNSGGPLIDTEGNILGINTFILRDGNTIGFSLPAKHIKEAAEKFGKGNGEAGTRCTSCLSVVFENTVDNKHYCPNCGTKVVLPSHQLKYQVSGVPLTIERMIEKLGYDIRICRQGAAFWEIKQGTATINVSYHQQSGLIACDAFLCTLPTENVRQVYEYLLRENRSNDNITLSVKGQDVIVSVLIFDRYLREETGMKLLGTLFEKADYYDNILVEQYGCGWRTVS